MVKWIIVSQNEWQGGMFSVRNLSLNILTQFFLSPVEWHECRPNHRTCPTPCNILEQHLCTHRSLSVSVRVFCCRRWTMKTVTATPTMSPMATTPPRIPITPPGGPCGFSADMRRNNSVTVSVLCVIDVAGLTLKVSRKDRKHLNNSPSQPQKFATLMPGYHYHDGKCHVVIWVFWFFLFKISFCLVWFFPYITAHLTNVGVCFSSGNFFNNKNRNSGHLKNGLNIFENENSKNEANTMHYGESNLIWTSNSGATFTIRVAFFQKTLPQTLSKEVFQGETIVRLALALLATRLWSLLGLLLCF